MNIQEFEYKAGMAARLLKALASSPRLMVLCHLADGEKSVGEIAGLTGLRMSAVSQNLAVLRAEQLVAPRRDGTTIHYRLADPTARKVIDVLYRAFCKGSNTAEPRQKTRIVRRRGREASPFAK
jgi:ArsR family transcriptional regulator